MKLYACSLKGKNKIDKHLARFIKQKREHKIRLQLTPQKYERLLKNTLNNYILIN